jgi:hypothetical protein
MLCKAMAHSIKFTGDYTMEGKKYKIHFVNVLQSDLILSPLQFKSRINPTSVKMWTANGLCLRL